MACYVPQSESLLIEERPADVDIRDTIVGMPQTQELQKNAREAKPMRTRSPSLPKELVGPILSSCLARTWQSHQTAQISEPAADQPSSTQLPLAQGKIQVQLELKFSRGPDVASRNSRS